MFKRFFLRLVQTTPADEAVAEESAFAERRAGERQPVFREAMLALEDYHKIRAVIKDVSPGGVGVEFFDRVDLPGRVRLVAPSLKLKCWTRVVWQRSGAAGLEFLPDEPGAGSP